MYPDITETVGLDPNDPNSVMSVIAASVETVYSGETVIDARKEPRQDVIDLLEQLPGKQFQEVQNFFVTMPKLQKDVMFKCFNCEQVNARTLEGLADFF